jgi:hypothetical protein
MSKSKKPFKLNEVQEFYVKNNANSQTAEYIAEKVGCDVSDIIEIYNSSKDKKKNFFQSYNGTVSMTEAQGVSDDESTRKDNINHEYLEKYKNSRHQL